MQNLIAVIFEGKNQAEDIMSYLAGAKFSYMMDIENSCVLMFDELNRVSLQRSLPESLPGPKDISYWKVLANNILPKKYMISFISKDRVILEKLDMDQNFIDQLHSNLKPDSSALLICIKGALPRRIESVLVRFNGLVLSTPFSNLNEARINTSLLPSAPLAAVS
jgi:uncharacterized membrane protein